MKAMAATEPAASAPEYRPRPLASLLCDLLPSQGNWSDDAYLWLTDHGNRLVELTVAALRLRIREGKFREPDLLMLRDRSDPRHQDRYWLGADLVVEVVSPDDPDRDLVEKRADYAEGGIPEYWIADPRGETITVLALEGEAYVEHGVFGRGGAATSPLLEGFAADVSAVFDAPE